MEATSENPWDSIAAELEQAARGFGARVENHVRDKLSVPVEYVTGPRGGTRVIRSLPGEPPRRETGNLQGSIQARFFFEGSTIAVELDSPVGYAVPLQVERDRPIFSDLPDLFGDEWVNVCARAVSGESAAE